MAQAPASTSPDQQGRLFIGLAFVLATAVRAVFALAYPTIHGGDAAARLAHADAFLLGYQLPLPQAFVVLAKSQADDPLLARLIFCGFGGALASGMTALLAVAAGSRAALFGALLFAFDPLLVHYSIVPYQEPLAYALAAWAFFFAASSRPRIGGALLALACLCRYEVWLLLPLLFWASRSRAGVLIGALPVGAWVLFWGGLAPRGLYVLDIDPSADRISRVAYLGSKLVEYETLAVPILALVALVAAYLEGARTVLRFAAALFMVIAVVVAFGHEYPPGSGLMSERLIHLPVILALSLLAAALARLSLTSRPAFLACAGGVALLAARDLRFERALLKAAAVEPDLALARDTARAIEAQRRPGECVSVLAPSVDPSLLDAYVSKVASSFGDAEAARARAANLAQTSPDRDRIAAHLRARPGTVRAEPGCPLLVLVDAQTQATEMGTLLAEIRAGPRRARLLRTRD